MLWQKLVIKFQFSFRCTGALCAGQYQVHGNPAVPVTVTPCGLIAIQYIRQVEVEDVCY